MASLCGACVDGRVAQGVRSAWRSIRWLVGGCQKYGGVNFWMSFEKPTRKKNTEKQTLESEDSPH